MNRRGRSALLWALVSFAVCQLSMAVAIEKAHPEFRDPEFGYRRNRLVQRLTNAPTKPFTTVMLGSSRTTVGFDAGILERQLAEHLQQPAIAFNFGVTGAGPLTHLLNLRRLLKDNVRPDLVMIEILPPLLNGQPWNQESLRLRPERLWHEEVGVLKSYGAPPGMEARWLAGWPVPFYEHRFALLSRFLPSWLPYEMRLDWAIGIDDSGYSPRPKMRRSAEGDRIALENMRKDYSVRLSEFKLGGQACRGLIELVDLCQQENLPAALVLMPEGSDFHALYTPAVWKQIDGFLKDVAARGNIPLFSAREWLADSAFVDSHHLVQAGAEQFTVRLGRDCVLPLVDRLRSTAKQLIAHDRVR
jgi:hypothetical protein